MDLGKSAQGPDLLQVVVTHEDELAATHADLRVTVRGSSLVTGDAALKKAREVAAMVQALAAVGIAEDAIRVEDISVQVESGLLTKSSSATYTLKVRCTKLDSLADVLGAVTAQKNAEIGHIDWGYAEPDELRTRWLVDCAARATERARQIAAALGVRLLGVHTFGEPDVQAASPTEYAPRGMLGGTARARMGAADLGLSVAHNKKIVVRVVAAFRIGGYE
jgi:uncharacterized protein YggE